MGESKTVNATTPLESVANVGDQFIGKIAVELSIAPQRVRAASRLLAEGATVPFIARYRKEATGSLDEVAITNIRDRMASLVDLESRRDAIIKSLQERNLLTHRNSKTGSWQPKL